MGKKGRFNKSNFGNGMGIEYYHDKTKQAYRINIQSKYAYANKCMQCIHNNEGFCRAYAKWCSKVNNVVTCERREE